MASTYDPRDKFSQSTRGMVLVGLSPTEAEISEARGRISSGESSMDVWADIDARVEKRMRARIDAGDTLPKATE